MRNALQGWQLFLSLLALSATVLIIGCGGGASPQAKQVPSGPPPSITSLSPSSAHAGAALTLTITGTNFVSGATVSFNGASLSAMFVSSTQLAVPLISGNLVATGSYPVTVTNPGGATSNVVNFTVSEPITSGIPATFFGLHVANVDSDFPLQVSFGGWRNLSSKQVWADINTCNVLSSECQSDPAANSSFDFSTLDNVLAQAKTAGVSEILFTLSFTPAWAAAVTPSQSTCTIPPSGCILPPDINPDGSGVNAVWDNWVENIAAHVNNPAWLQTHAHIRYWEPWNEVFSDLTINVCCAPQSTTATYAQLLRLTEDTRCVIAGTGTIHNYPAAGGSTPCSSYLASHGYSIIDSSAQIVLPSMGGMNGSDVAQWVTFMQNFLYCSANPAKDLNSGSATSCTWGGGLNWMSAAVDIINWHLYVQEEEPEADLPIGSANNWVGSIDGALSPADLAKPLWSGEGSCGTPPSFNPNHIWGDDYSMAGFVARFSALLWSAGVTSSFWFEYDLTPIPYCPLWNGSSLTPAGVAWNVTYSWLLGATPVSSPFCSNVGTVWTCPFTEANGAPAELVWDAQFGPGGTTAPSDCTLATNPVICGNTPYAVPAQYTNDWVDLSGTVHPFQSPVTVGAQPILLE